MRERVLAEARGNPLALLELPRALSSAQLTGGFGLPGARTVPTRVEDSFRQRLEVLPGDTRRLLLVAAMEPVGDAALVWRAAERLQIPTSAAVPAEADGLLEIDARVRFRHPLVRSAAYRSASLQQRQTTHLALAEATDRELDPDRRAWHLAWAAPGPDEDVAVELERSANRARARGGVTAAAAFLQRSVELTSDPARRSRRALAAAQAHVQAGAFDAALELLTTAAPLDELQLAQVDRLRGEIALASRDHIEASALLLGAAKRLEPLDLALARDTYLDAWVAAMFAGAAAPAGTLQEVSRAAASTPQPAGGPRPSDLLLDALAVLVLDGRAAAASRLRRAARAFAESETIEETLRWGWPAAIPAVVLWDDESWYSITDGLLQSAREAGLLVHLPIYLNSVGIAAVARGDFATAGSLIAEADLIVEAVSTRSGRFAAVMLAGLRGNEAEAAALIEVVVNDASAGGQGQGIQLCRWVLAILHNGLGRYDEALASAEQASEHAREPYISAWALVEVIEAATRTGETGRAVWALERLVEATSVSDSDWGLGVLARSRALLSEGEEAEASYREAIDRLGRTRLRPELARAHLLYGEWLRRGGRRVNAREQLRAAHDQFTSIGMEAFAERSRRELLATGEKARRRSPGARDELTPQEAQVAELARAGLSNPEIAAQLFLSPRTVEYHLRKVFAKLEISSRHQLPGALPDGVTAASVG